MKKRWCDEEEVLVGCSQIYAKEGDRGTYVKCGFCSDFYLRGTLKYALMFLKKSDSIFGNSDR